MNYGVAHWRSTGWVTLTLIKCFLCKTWVLFAKHVQKMYLPVIIMQEFNVKMQVRLFFKFGVGNAFKKLPHYC